MILIQVTAGVYPNVRINPMIVSAAMTISSFTVCRNALRLNLFKVHDASHDRPLRHRALPDDGSALVQSGGRIRAGSRHGTGRRIRAGIR
ncbi:hypothetical protein [Lachnoclostridium sp. Marseille-P6806]|uniref:hypothetical protein n=1 Tax=Lachnoclostridium sp. Marseille-P6806 TaxID=2364793 RepID=UPI0013EF046E|nr:hypothetical protein [Lachnoclostridium sp. Marseille-P6806]